MARTPLKRFCLNYPFALTVQKLILHAHWGGWTDCGRGNFAGWPTSTHSRKRGRVGSLLLEWQIATHYTWQNVLSSRKVDIEGSRLVDQNATMKRRMRLMWTVELVIDVHHSTCFSNSRKCNRWAACVIQQFHKGPKKKETTHQVMWMLHWWPSETCIEKLTKSHEQTLKQSLLNHICFNFLKKTLSGHHWGDINSKSHTRWHVF